MPDPMEAWTPARVRQAADLAERLERVRAAQRAGGTRAKLEISGGVGWRDCALDIDVAWDALDAQAKRLRAQLAAMGVEVGDA